MKKKSLSLKQLFQGLMAALEMAENLCKEAQLLESNGKIASAFSKCVLSVEEFGKHRLMFLQAGIIQQFGAVGDKVWARFWRHFYSHQKKLTTSLEYNYFLLGHGSVHFENLPQFKNFFNDFRSIASELDKRKQKGSYVDFENEDFSIPDDEEFIEGLETFLDLIEFHCSNARKTYPKNMGFDDFIGVLNIKLKYTNALYLLDGLDGKKTDDFHQILLDFITPVGSFKDSFPTDDDFIARVEERYEVIPRSIPATLATLNKSIEFQSFYNSLKDKYGYPDWVILGVIYNIVFNIRINSVDKPEEILNKALACEPIEAFNYNIPPIEEFIDIEKFEFALDCWLTSFLIGLGVVLPEDVKIENKQLRRIAAHWYGIFNRDVEHDKIFHFGNVTN